MYDYRMGYAQPQLLQGMSANLLAIGSATNSNAVLLNAFDTPAGMKLVAFGMNRQTTASPTRPTISDSNTNSWIFVDEHVWNLGDGGAGMAPYARITLFKFTPGSDQDDLVITMRSNSANFQAYGVLGFQTPNTSILTNIKWAHNINGDPSLTMDSAPAEASLVVGLFVGCSNISPLASISAEFNQSPIAAYSLGTGMQALVHQRHNSAATAVAWTSLSTVAIGGTFEVPRT